MKYGLTAAEFGFLESKVLFPLKSNGALIYLFGSRAKGCYRKFSDIDLLIESAVDLSKLISSISEELELSNFPYKIDIVEEKFLADSFRAEVLQSRAML